MPHVECSECGASIQQKRRLACVGECTKARGRKRDLKNYARRRDAGLISKEARGEASRKWAAKNPDRRAEFMKNWRAKNSSHTADYDRQYRERNADAVRAKNQRRRARLADAFVEDVDLRELYQRDDGVCGICRDVVDASLKWPHKLSKTLDHIVPISKGGEHSWANAQLAHAVCNSRKCDRIT